VVSRSRRVVTFNILTSIGVIPIDYHSAIMPSIQNNKNMEKHDD